MAAKLKLIWFPVLLAYASLFSYGLIDNARGPIFPDLLKEFELSDSEGAFFFFLSSGAALLNNVFGYGFMQRLGAYRALQFYTLMQGLGVLIVGFAPNYAVVLVGAVIAGSALGGLGIAPNSLVAENTPLKRRRQALLGLHCMYGIASLLAPLYVSGAYHLTLGWQATFAMLCLFPALVIGFSSLPQGRLFRHKGMLTIEESPAHHRPEPRSPWREAIYFAGVLSFYVVAELSLSTRLALYARREAGYSIDQANILVSLYFVGLFLGRLIFTLVPLPFSNRLLLSLSAGVGLVTYSLGLTHHAYWLALTGLAISIFYPVAIDLIHEEAQEQSAFVMHWSITLQALALMTMHLTIGQLADIWGLRAALWMGPVCLGVSLFLLGIRALRPGSAKSV